MGTIKFPISLGTTSRKLMMMGFPTGLLIITVYIVIVWLECSIKELLYVEYDRKKGIPLTCPVYSLSQTRTRFNYGWIKPVWGTKIKCCTSVASKFLLSTVADTLYFADTQKSIRTPTPDYYLLFFSMSVIITQLWFYKSQKNSF